MNEKYWSELAHNLKTRRNIESALFDPAATNYTPYHWENDKTFQARKLATIKLRRKERKEFLESLGLRNYKEANARIADLKEREKELWHILRPDLEGFED